MPPIFLFSLPRSGSTLVQRILASHEAVSTASEPWVALPVFYSRTQGSVFAEYEHRSLATAVTDFVEALPYGEDQFFAAARDYLQNLYDAATDPGASYFLDKTPRYHLICDDLVRCFPDAKFIVLWRNPLAVAASIINTWGRGRWNLYKCKVDLFKGVERLTELVERRRERLCTVRYEDLVTRPEEEIERICEYLEISFDVNALERFPELNLAGLMGDPTGVTQYKTVSAEPMEKWKSSFRSPLRKLWARRYLRWVGAPRLEAMGYDFPSLCAELDALPNGPASLASDLVWMTWGFAYIIAEPYFVYQKLKTLRSWPEMVPHF